MERYNKKVVKSAAREAIKKFDGGIVVDGITRKVNKVTRKEYTSSNYSEKITEKFPTLYADKMRSASALDDIVFATTDWARDGKLVHPRVDNFVDFDHGNVLIETAGRQYNAEVVVGITDKGESVFYDVVDIEPVNFTLKNRNPQPTLLRMNRLTPYMRIPLRIVYAKAVEMSIVFLRIKQNNF